MKLFKTRSLTGTWWVRTSVSEESLRAPSLALVSIKRRIFLPLQNKWLITVLRARSAPRLLETRGISEQDSDAKVSIILFSGVIPSRRQTWSTMMSTEKGTPPPHPIHTNAHTHSTAKETLTCWRAFLLSAICFLYFQRLLRADLCADPVPTLPFLSFSLAINRFQPLNRDMNHRQLVSAAENIRSHQRIFSWPFPQQGAAPTAQTEMTGKIMRSEALLDETHTQRVSPPHTRIPMVFLHTPPALLHFDILLRPPPTPLLHRHQHSQSSFGTR